MLCPHSSLSSRRARGPGRAHNPAIRVKRTPWHDGAQAAFHVFGMELLAQLDLQATQAFFTTFFQLPDSYWRGFLASNLSSSQLIAFALLIFWAAPPGIKAALLRHLVRDPVGPYLIRYYLSEPPWSSPKRSFLSKSVCGSEPTEFVLVGVLVALVFCGPSAASARYDRRSGCFDKCAVTPNNEHRGPPPIRCLLGELPWALT